LTLDLVVIVAISSKMNRNIHLLTMLCDSDV